MAKILSSAGIVTGSPILPAQFTQVINAFTGADAYNITISGSLANQGNLTVTDGTGSFQSVAISQVLSLGLESSIVNANGITLFSGGAAGNGFTGSFTGSFFGDGSQLTNISVAQTASGTPNSVQFRDGSNTVASGSSNFTFLKASNSLSLSGSLTVSGSGLSNTGPITQTGAATINGDTTITGSLVSSGSSHSLTGGLTVSGSTVFQGGNIDATTIRIIGDQISGSFSGSYEGDGSSLDLLGSINTLSDVITTGVTGGIDRTPAAGHLLAWDNSIAQWGPTSDDQLVVNVTASSTFSGSLTHVGGVADFTGATAISGSNFSGSFAGDGSGLTNVSATWNGVINGNAIITGSLTVSGSNVVIDAQNARIVGDQISGSFSGSYEGDGSGLTGVTGEWDGSRNGDSEITGSLVVTADVTASVVSALSASQLITDKGYPAGAGTYSGEAIRYGTTSTTAGLIYSLTASAGWAESSNATGQLASSSIAIASGTSANDGMIVRGLVDVGYAAGTVVGEPLYLGTNGSASATAPSSAGEVVRLVGHYYGGNDIYFNPSNDFIKL